MFLLPSLRVVKGGRERRRKCLCSGRRKHTQLTEEEGEEEEEKEEEEEEGATSWVLVITRCVVATSVSLLQKSGKGKKGRKKRWKLNNKKKSQHRGVG